MYNMIYVSWTSLTPVYSRSSFIFIFLLTDTIYSCLSYCSCIVIPLFTSIIEENTLKAPLKRLSDSRSSHIWITNVAGSPRTEVMLVKGCEGYPNDGKIVSQQWRFNTTWINRRREVSADQSVLSFNALSQNHATHSRVLSWARASLVISLNVPIVAATSIKCRKLNRMSLNALKHMVPTLRT